MLPKRSAGVRPGCRGLSGGRKPQCSGDSSRAQELCRAGNCSETADTGRREQQQCDPQRSIIAHGPTGGGMWPWDGGGHDFSFLDQKWQAGWHDRKAHPPDWKFVITCMAPAGSGAGGAAGDVQGGTCCPWGSWSPRRGWPGAGGPGMSSQSPVTHPAACQLMGAACREPQLTGAPAASPGCLAQQRVPAGPGTHWLARC